MQYLYCFPPPLGPESCYFSTEDFGKPGIASLPYTANATSHSPTLTALYTKATGAATHILAHLTFPDTQLSTLFGAPRDVWVNVSADEAGVGWTVEWYNKTATRLPESLWFIFNPDPAPVGGVWDWRIMKAGWPVDPTVVVTNASRHLHSVDPVRCYLTLNNTTRLWSFDAALVAPGGPSLTDFTNAPVGPPLRAKGVALNLMNNLYDTNYIMWFPYDTTPAAANSRFRFKLTF